jgi:hypothetical protein
MLASLSAVGNGTAMASLIWPANVASSLFMVRIQFVALSVELVSYHSPT